MNIYKEVEIINDMSADDATDLMDEIPANVVHRLLKKVDSDNEDIKSMMEEIRRGFLVFAGRYNGLTDEIKDFIYERSLFYISKDDLYKSPLLPFLAYNRCLYEKGIITKDEILKRCDIYFKPMIEEFGKKEYASFLSAVSISTVN